MALNAIRAAMLTPRNAFHKCAKETIAVVREERVVDALSATTWVLARHAKKAGHFLLISTRTNLTNARVMLRVSKLD